jgi:3-oxoacyl-[acyl-carrier-protein] synthase-3
MTPYTRDPFRGTVERRVLGPGESSIMLETRVARAALEAAKLASEEVDLMIVASMFPDQRGPGNAAYVAGELGLRCAAWNLEASCAGTQVSLQVASNMVRAGGYRNVLVVTSCTYSRFGDTANDTLSFAWGDGASAFVVGEVGEGQGLLSTKAVNASATCGMFFNEVETDRQGKVREYITAGKNAGKLFRERAFAEECSRGALAAAGVTVDDIDLFVFFSATAWQHQFTAQVLGADPARVFDLFPRYATSRRRRFRYTCITLPPWAGSVPVIWCLPTGTASSEARRPW